MISLAADEQKSLHGTWPHTRYFTHYTYCSADIILGPRTGKGTANFLSTVSGFAQRMIQADAS